MHFIIEQVSELEIYARYREMQKATIKHEGGAMQDYISWTTIMVSGHLQMTASRKFQV